MPGAAPLWGQVQVSPASVVAELNAVVGVALDAADDDDAISLTVLGTLVCQHGAKLCVALFHVLSLLVIVATQAQRSERTRYTAVASSLRLVLGHWRPSGSTASAVRT
jgi:hypothetical protein